MIEIWLASDYHFYHRNIIDYCSRPFSDEHEMNLAMVQQWNLRVERDDIVVFVGDLSAGLKGRRAEFKELIGTLKGRKVLVRGNHDHEPDEFYVDAGFIAVRDHVLLDEFLFVHTPATVGNGKRQRLHDVTIALQKQHSPFLTIHGHTHGPGPEVPGHFNVAADRHSYVPITLSTVLERSNLSAYKDSLYAAVKQFVNETTPAQR